MHMVSREAYTQHALPPLPVGTHEMRDVGYTELWEHTEKIYVCLELKKPITFVQRA